MKVIVTALFFIGLLLESTIIRLPLLLILLLNLFVRRKSPDIFAIAFFLGLMLDILTVQRIGLSSLFFIVFLFLVFLYERKYEINTIPFVLIASTLAYASYALQFSGSILFLQVVFSTILTGFIFFMFKFLYK